MSVIGIEPNEIKLKTKKYTKTFNSLQKIKKAKQKQLKKELKIKILNFLCNKHELFKIKQRIIILRILQIREKSAIKIQQFWRQSQLKLNIHKLSHHVHGCYTISPSINNISKIFIKIYTNDINNLDFKILQMRFCPIRKSFVIDIPKNKFCNCSKILHFNFIYKDKIYFDEKYKKILFCNDYVHELNLDDYDKKQQTFDNIYNEIIDKINLKNKIENSSFEEDEETDEYSDLKPNTYLSNDSKEIKFIKKSLMEKRFESCDLIKKNYSSILRNPYGKRRNNKKLTLIAKRRVSFGTIEYIQ